MSLSTFDKTKRRMLVDIVESSLHSNKKLTALRMVENWQQRLKKATAIAASASHGHVLLHALVGRKTSTLQAKLHMILDAYM